MQNAQTSHRCVQAAWFEDTEGNILCLDEDLA
jgi:hypothetical protein